MSAFYKSFYLSVAILAAITSALFFVAGCLSMAVLHAFSFGLLLPSLVAGLGAAMACRFYREEKGSSDNDEENASREGIYASEERSLSPVVLTTRTRTLIAILSTLYVLVLAYRGPIRSNNRTDDWLLLDWFFGAHGWILVAVNAAFYAYLCWLAVSFVRGTSGRERVFMMGWFLAILIRPLKLISPAWAVAERYVSILGLTAAAVSAVSLLLRAPVGGRRDS